MIIVKIRRSNLQFEAGSESSFQEIYDKLKQILYPTNKPTDLTFVMATYSMVGRVYNPAYLDVSTVVRDLHRWGLLIFEEIEENGQGNQQEQHTGTASETGDDTGGVYSQG